MAARTPQRVAKYTQDRNLLFGQVPRHISHRRFVLLCGADRTSFKLGRGKRTSEEGSLINGDVRLEGKDWPPGSANRVP